MRLFKGRSGAVLAIVVLALCALLAGQFDQAGPPVSGRARISDGDSFHLGDERIRLLGMDAPELAQTCTDAQGRDWPCGHTARDRMAALVAGQALACQPHGRDRFGRILATCTVGGRDIGAQMVEAGLAIASDDYGREEAAARKARRGLWAGTFQMPRAWRDSHAREGERSPIWGWLPDFKL